MERDLYEPTTGVGFDFSTPYLYNGMGFAGQPDFVECAENSNATACADMLVCVLDSTTYVDLVTTLLPEASVTVTPDADAFYESFRTGFCNVLAGDQFEIAEPAVRQKGYFGDYQVGQSLYSKEPLALVTTEDDPTWSDFVNWVVQSLLAAEEQGFTQQVSDFFPMVPVFGQEYESMFVNALKEVGNYGEMVRARTQQVQIVEAFVNLRGMLISFLTTVVLF